MASHVDNTVVERRLRPIYDSLENGNNKKALQETEKVLRKQPGNQCARVLKALALFRLGKESECQAIMDKVRSEVPCEDSTLQAMSICYMEMNQLDKICDIYKAASEVDPHNEELLVHLFMAYVRLKNYKQQKQTVFTLYKLKPRNPYLCWAFMSLFMEAKHEINGDLARNVILPLAEKMVLKFIEKEELETEQGVELYLMILKYQKKREEILEVLLGPLGSNLSNIDHKASLLLEYGMFREAADIYKLLIEENIQGWDCYPKYIYAALTFQKPIECLNFLEKLCKLEPKTRAPYLAKLEVLEQSRMEGYKIHCVDYMCGYFKEVGDRKCVVEDLRLYLTLLTSTEKKELINRLTEIVGVAPDGYPNTAEQMQQHIHLEQLRRLCGYHHPPLADLNERTRLITRLYDLYKKGNELFSFADRLPTDFCLADSYILMVGHLLHQLWCETNEASYLYSFRAMTYLQNGLLSSPANFQIKLILQRIYLEAGLIVPADHIFVSLDVKHIQLDSLGFLTVSLLAPLGELLQASTALDNCMKFYAANYKDSADYLTSAYKYGSFTKIPEFVDLSELLENSIQFATITIDKMLLELSCCDSSKSLFSLLANMHIKPSEDRIKWNELRDNRDLKVIRGWEPVDKTDQDPTKERETFECILKLLQARNLMLRIVAATAESDPLLLVVLAQSLKTLNNFDIPHTLRKISVDEKTNKSCGILVPLDSVIRLQEAYYSDQLRTVANVAEQLHWQPSRYNDLIEILSTGLCLQPLCLPTHNEPISFKNFLLRASTCSETLAIITAMCVAYSRRFQSVISNKKGKKNEIHEGWKAIATFLTEKVENLDEALTKLMKYPLQTGLENEDNVCVKIMKQGQASLAQSCKSLKSRSQLILKLLSSLKD